MDTGAGGKRCRNLDVRGGGSSQFGFRARGEASVLGNQAHALSASFGTTLLRAVFAGWLIALMVWLLPGAEGSRPFIIVVITYVVSLAGFSHIVAGSVDCLFLVETGQTTWLGFIWAFFIPTLIGNILGGVALVAVLNYGQVAQDIE